MYIILGIEIICYCELLAQLGRIMIRSLDFGLVLVLCGLFIYMM